MQRQLRTYSTDAFKSITTTPNPLKMQQMFVFFALVAFVAAQPALFPTSVAPLAYTNLPNVAAPASPLAVSSSQRLDYYNQFNAAFAPQAPPARLVATPAGLAAFPTLFGFPAANRFSQPTRFLAAAPATPSFFF